MTRKYFYAVKIIYIDEADFSETKEFMILHGENYSDIMNQLITYYGEDTIMSVEIHICDEVMMISNDIFDYLVDDNNDDIGLVEYTI